MLWIETLFHRIVIFLIFFLIIVLYLYGLGNLQSFLDKTQVLLFRVAEITSLFLIFGAIYYAVISITASIIQKKTRINTILLSLLGLCMGGGVYVLINYLFRWINFPD